MLIAGGIGITPMISMARHLEIGGRQWSLQYFTRSIPHTAFHELLSEKRFLGKVTFHYACGVRRAYAPICARSSGTDRTDAELYLCGPRPFMDLVENTAAATWPPEAVNLEYFSADSASLAGPRDTFTVKLARTGGDVRYPGGQEHRRGARRSTASRSRPAASRACAGRASRGVLEGEPDHRDVFLTDEEKRACDKMMCCVSRAKSESLTLDL